MSFHDSWGVPSVCPSCEISILPGTDHTTDDGCFVALKQFVKLCQDEIESSRMRDFQHPTREELLERIIYITEQFDRFVVYVTSMRDELRKASHGTMVQ
jgi:hypothetical protein